VATALLLQRLNTCFTCYRSMHAAACTLENMAKTTVPSAGASEMCELRPIENPLFCPASMSAAAAASSRRCMRNQAAAVHDYEAFVRSELPIREALLYPPFGHVIRFVVRSLDDQAAATWAGAIADRLRQAAGAAAGIRVLGPAPGPIARLRDRFRWHVQLHGPDGPTLRDLVRRATADLKTPETIAWIVDVDPVEML
jgi:hypothetical protein